MKNMYSLQSTKKLLTLPFTLLLLLVFTAFTYGQTTVYIDPSYTGSTQNGTLQNPYKSWSSITWTNGTTYLQKASTTYNTSGSLIITSKNNITLGAYGTGDKPQIISSGGNSSKVIDITSCYNMVITGLEVASTTGQVTAAVIIDGTGSSNNLIDDCILRDVQWGIRILTTSAGNRILNCEVYNTQDDGIYIKDTPDIEIGYCNVYNVNLKYFVNPDQSYSPGDNIQIASTNSHNFYVHHNTLDHSTTGNKFCFIAWGNNYSGILENNTMIGNPNQTTSCVYLSPTTSSVTVRYNTFKDGNYGIYAYVTNFNAYYNDFIHNRTAICVLNNYHMLAENNVFYDNVNTCISGLPGSNVISKNNIFHISGNTKAYSTYGSLTSNYNTFNTQYSGFINGYGTLSAWRSASGQDQNSMVANPMFSNPSAHDFTLQQNSPCINAGLMCGYNQDHFGNAVPHGNSSDIGFHEYASTNNNQAPVISNQSFSVTENSSSGTIVGQVIASDPDAGQTLTYSITSGNTNTTFSINPTTGAITVANNEILNFESNPTFNLQITVQDNLNASSSATITINLQDVNENPVIDDQGFEINENLSNGSVVGTVIASDPDQGQQLTYSITSGNTGNTFTINPSTGSLSVANNQQLNFESNTSFNLNVLVQDNGAGTLSDNGLVHIQLNDINEPPITSNHSFSLPITTPNGTFVGEVTATDPDNNQTITYSITSGNQYNTFAIGSSNGEITVVNASGLVSAGNPFILNVQVTDNGSPQLSANSQVTINITEYINSAPVISPQSFAVGENSAQGTIIGQVVASDPDQGQNLTYSIVSGNNANAFNLSVHGLLTVNNAAALNFEDNSSFDLMVMVTDDGEPAMSSQGLITISITDVNEMPTVTPGQKFDVLSTAPYGYIVGTVLAVDPDLNQSLTFQITNGNSQNVFAINSSTGDITIDNTTMLSRMNNRIIQLTVKVTDNGNPSLFSSETVTVRVIKKRKNSAFAIGPMAEREVMVYPNPSIDGKFTVNAITVEESITTIRVSDMSGNFLYSDQTMSLSQYELNLSHLPKGMYIMQIIQGSESKVKKLIIQ